MKNAIVESYNYNIKKIFKRGQEIDDLTERKKYYETVLLQHERNSTQLDESMYDPEHDLDEELKSEIAKISERIKIGDITDGNKLIIPDTDEKDKAIKNLANKMRMILKIKDGRGITNLEILLKKEQKDRFEMVCKMLKSKYSEITDAMLKKSRTTLERYIREDKLHEYGPTGKKS